MLSIPASLSRSFSCRPFRPTTLALAALLLAVPLLPDSASADTGWSVRASGIRVDPRFDVVEDGTEVSTDAATGFALGVGYRWSDRFGMSLDVLSADPDVTAENSDEPLLADGSFSFEPVVLGAQFHLTPRRRADFWVGLALAHVRYGDVTLGADVGTERVEVRFDAEDDWAPGAEVGVDVALGSGPWSLTASALYLETELVVEDPDGETSELDIEPLVAAVGVRYRF